MKPYEAPKIEKLGTVAEVTGGSSTGGYLDANFSAGTPYGNLTFS